MSEETPIAQVALAEDRVVEVSDGLEREVPERYARFAGVTTLTCTPVSAGGRWLGVLFADRGAKLAARPLPVVVALAGVTGVVATVHLVWRLDGIRRIRRAGPRGLRATRQPRTT